MTWTLVTGGAQGLGKEICKRLMQEGHSLIIHYRTSKDSALKLQEECRLQGVEAHIVHGDFSDLKNIKLFAHSIKELQVPIANIIHNVALYNTKKTLALKPLEFEQLLHTNILAPYIITEQLLPSIKKNKGNIISIGTAGINSAKAEVHAGAYMMTKRALFDLTRSMAKELVSDGVRVNMVSPGFLERSVDQPGPNAKLINNRVASPKEIVNAIIFLLSPDNDYITGQNIEVTGGFKL